MATRIETPYTLRARYYSSADGFDLERPRVPAHVFLAERERAWTRRRPPASSPST